ncbi:MAG: 30S ribosome-binding factor RbfA [Acidimicrobiia bacterium]
MTGRRGRPSRYTRTDRLNQLVRQILADELERINDDALDLVTVMDVVVEADLGRATVYVDTPEGDARDAEVVAALEGQRARLQAALAKQARMRRTPTLTFRPDDVERAAARVEAMLRDLGADD